MHTDPSSSIASEPLDAVAARVLGGLVEKAFTTPDNYPLTLNSLTAACNQTSNREPVMTLAEGDVAAGVSELIRRSLAREVYRSDSRVKRYRHALADTLHLHAPEQAALCVLLLRGPQTPGEIKGRTARMTEFIDASHVEITLRSLATLVPPLVAPLPRQPGQKEVRWAHLLSGEPQLAAAVVAAPESAPPPASMDRIEELEQDVASLRAEVAELRAQLDAFRAEFR